MEYAIVTFPASVFRCEVAAIGEVDAEIQVVVHRGERL
jgi:hypothetical protein